MICLENLNQLQLMWLLYCDDNDGRLINMANGIDRPGELAWVGQTWHSNFGGGQQLPIDQQIAEIKGGSMWEYAKDLKLYACPTGLAGEMCTYAGMDGVNAYPQPGNLHGRTGTTNLIMKNMSDVRKPHSIIVIIDEGWGTPDSFATHYTQALWWDDPPVRHGEGATVSFADGHTEYKKWQGSDTIEFGINAVIGHSNNYAPTTPDGHKDLQWVQRGCWGGLGYIP